MDESMEGILERAKKIKELNDKDYERYFVEYRDKETGEKIEGIPKQKSPLRANRGFCIFCNKVIKESVSDDRFCRSCYGKQFPDDVK